MLGFVSHFVAGIFRSPPPLLDQCSVTLGLHFQPIVVTCMPLDCALADEATITTSKTNEAQNARVVDSVADDRASTLYATSVLQR